MRLSCRPICRTRTRWSRSAASAKSSAGSASSTPDARRCRLGTYRFAHHRVAGQRLHVYRWASLPLGSARLGPVGPPAASVRADLVGLPRLHRRPLVRAAGLFGALLLLGASDAADSSYGPAFRGLQIGISVDDTRIGYYSTYHSSRRSVPVIIRIRNSGSRTIGLGEEGAFVNLLPIVTDSRGARLADASEFRCTGWVTSSRRLFTATVYSIGPPPPFDPDQVMTIRYELGCWVKLVDGETYSVRFLDPIRDIGTLTSNTVTFTVMPLPSPVPMRGHATASPRFDSPGGTSPV